AAQAANDVVQSSLSARRPFGPKAELGQREIQVVANDQQVPIGQLIKISSLHDARAALVHKRMRREQQGPLALQISIDRLALEVRPAGTSTEQPRQLGDHLETDIVPRRLVLAAGIA